MNRNSISNRADEADNFDLNHCYRNGGNLIEDRDSGHDCVTQMRMLRSRPEVLANMLREMGVTENGDEVPDDE